MSSEKLNQQIPQPPSGTSDDSTAASSTQAAPEEATNEPRPPELDEASRKYYEALVQRIADTYARFTPEEMEMVKWLGWG